MCVCMYVCNALTPPPIPICFPYRSAAPKNPTDARSSWRRKAQAQAQAQAKAGGEQTNKRLEG